MVRDSVKKLIMLGPKHPHTDWAAGVSLFVIVEGRERDRKGRQMPVVLIKAELVSFREALREVCRHRRADLACPLEHSAVDPWAASSLAARVAAWDWGFARWL